MSEPHYIERYREYEAKVIDLEAQLAAARADAAQLATVLVMANTMMMATAADEYGLKEDAHRLSCPNRKEFSFYNCPYFSCKMTRESVQYIGELSRGEVAAALKAHVSLAGETTA